MPDIELQFLGSGDAFGSGGRLQTCMLLRGGAEPLLIDCGASSLIAMKRAGVDPSQIGTVLLTHLHGDHFGGIPFFILDAQFISRRDKPLVIAGPPGTEERVKQAMEVLFPGSSETRQRFEVHFLELEAGSTADVAGATVTPFEVVHASGAPPYAYRVEADGKSMAYSGDTEWTEALVEAAAGTDLFICESYYFDKEMKFHLSYQTLQENRARLACKRLVLTHVGPESLERRGAIREEIAEDGLVIRL
jgi:ribonuclease BN (tRNA processing enzyme)